MDGDWGAIEGEGRLLERESARVSREKTVESALQQSEQGPMIRSV